MTTKIPAELSSTPGISDSSNATAITIDSSENVTLGSALIVDGFGDSTGHYISLRSGYSPDESGGVGFQATDHSGSHADGLGIYGHDGISFYTSQLERARILSSGGITFNGDTATANALDDYEEGTWTPTLPSGGSITIYTATYTKVGRKVTAYCYVGATPTNDNYIFYIGGLPYTAPNNSNYYAGGSLSYSGSENTSSLGSPLVLYNNTVIYFHYLTGSGVQVKNNQFGGRTVPMILQVHYDAA